MHTTSMIFIKTCYDKTFKNCHLDELLFAEKFLAFKTPLGPRYDDEIPEANRFQLPMLFAYLQSLQVCAREFSCYQQDRYLLCWLGRSGNRVMVEERGGGEGGKSIRAQRALASPSFLCCTHLPHFAMTILCCKTLVIDSYQTFLLLHLCPILCLHECYFLFHLPYPSHSYFPHTAAPLSLHPSTLVFMRLSKSEVMISNDLNKVVEDLFFNPLTPRSD